jgi:hypothetical protein
MIKSVVRRRPAWRGRAAIVLFQVLAAIVVPAPAMAQPYRSVTIGEPAPNATIFDNAGNVAVAIATSPALRAGDRIALDIDGHPMPPRSQDRFELSGLDRGEHTLRARVVGPDGDTLIPSALVTFYVWRGSLLFPARRKG